MITSFLSFILLFLISNVLFSICTTALLVKLNKTNTVDVFFLIVAGFGLTPFIISLILYYLMLFVPQQGALFYLLVPSVIFIAIGLYAHKQIQVLWCYSKDGLAMFSKQIPDTINNINIPFERFFFIKNKIGFFKLMVLLATSYFIIQWLMQLISKPIIGHDMLEYAIQANYFAKHKIIEYIENRYHPESMFYYVGLHGFSFPLLGTWESLFNEVINKIGTDYYYKSVTGYYSILIFALQFYWLRKINYFLAFAAMIGLFFTHGFFLTITDYHVDTYRIFMIAASFTALAISIERKNFLSLLLLGLLTGGQAMIHSLGVFIAVFIFISFFLFYPVNIKRKFFDAFLLLILILITGGIHYILDVFIGTGWIFKEIKFY